MRMAGLGASGSRLPPGEGICEGEVDVPNCFRAFDSVCRRAHPRLPPDSSELGVDTLVASMKTIRFDVQGFSRTYYDFYLGFGLFVSVLQLFAALVCWQLGLLEAATLRSLSLLRWSMVICFLGVSYLSWQYFFMVPIVFSLAITLFLVLGAWLANKPA